MLGALVLTTLIQVSAPLQELAPGTQYDPAIPTLEGVVGHDFRERVTPPDQIIRYMEALARAAPDRTQLIRYAESMAVQIPTWSLGGASDSESVGLSLKQPTKPIKRRVNPVVVQMSLLCPVTCVPDGGRKSFNRSQCNLDVQLRYCLS